MCSIDYLSHSTNEIKALADNTKELAIVHDQTLLCAKHFFVERVAEFGNYGFGDVVSMFHSHSLTCCTIHN